MATPSFYHPSLNEQDSFVSLDAAEASHAVKARRLKVGQEVRLFNGNGLVAFGPLSQIDRRSASVEIRVCNRIALSERQLSVAVAIPKGDRQKVMLDMLTQLGVSEIRPLFCEYSVTKFSDKMLEKWRRITIEAAKQSQNPYLPTIQECSTVQEFVEHCDKPMLVANADGVSLCDCDFSDPKLWVIIGPEGGFSDVEFELFKSNDITSIALGGHILRTEAAAIAAASQFNLMRQTEP